MAGFCFRLDTDRGNTYGLSLFRNRRESLGPEPDWLLHFSPEDLDRISDDQGSLHLILWRCRNGEVNAAGKRGYALLEHMKLDCDPCTRKAVDGSGGLRDWTTLVLELEERRSQEDPDRRENLISGFVRAPDQGGSAPQFDYDPDDPIHWFFSEFCPADWNVRRDDALTTEGFDPADPPEEIGLHCFDDRNSPWTVFFTDFALRLVSPGGTSEGSGEF
jgi:hypothetical protein